MYIERLHLRNVRLLAEQEFSFLNSDGSPRMWTVLLGENGVCKSTILQSIALAAMGPKLGSALIGDTDRLRNITNKADASITASFKIPTLGHRPPPGQPDLLSSLLMTSKRHDLLPGDQQRPGEEPLLDQFRGERIWGLFIVGYGVGRYLARPGEVAAPEDPVLDRVSGLFDVRHKMLGINFSSVFGDGQIARRFSNYVLNVLLEGARPEERLLPGFLDLESDASLESSGFEFLMGESRLKLPATWLSDGYQAMLSWVADLLGNALLDIRDFPPVFDISLTGLVRPQELQGIVLLDEIDLHLHPAWQRRIIPLLRKIFPKLQFIVTTHSPLILTGFEREEIIRLRFHDGQVVQDPAEIQPGVLTASEILTSFFDVQRAGRPELVDKERRYLELRGIERPSEEQRKKLKELEEELAPYWTAGPSDAELRSPEEILKRGA
jgi:putative AbiEii toxin of type IV toxin-antitoxin system